MVEPWPLASRRRLRLACIESTLPMEKGRPRFQEAWVPPAPVMPIKRGAWYQAYPWPINRPKEPALQAAAVTACEPSRLSAPGPQAESLAALDEESAPTAEIDQSVTGVRQLSPRPTWPLRCAPSREPLEALDAGVCCG